MADQKWNLGDIRPAPREPKSRRRQSMTDVAPRTRRQETEEAPKRPARPARRSTTGEKGGRRAVLVGAAIILLIGLGFLTTLFLRGAELTVYPKFRDVTVQATFSAERAAGGGELGFELLTLEEVGERTVAASGSEEVEERAQGAITIFNTYSTTPQRLVKNTRFESPDGRIFRIDESAVVPGYTEEDGERIPGSIEAQVFADEPGEEYNIAPARFTVPGLEGSDQFEEIYAESSTAMTGGFVGERLTVSDTELRGAQDAIRGELRQQLLERLSTERPAGFVLYNESVRVRYESLPATEAGEGQATIREKAILEAPIFAEGDFAAYLAENTIAGYEGEAVRMENSQTLTFAYASASSTPTSSEVAFSLSGGTRVVWDYDAEELRSDVAGVAKTALPAILSKYPAIERAEAVVKPFWKGSFPEDAKRIKIIEVLQSS